MRGAAGTTRILTIRVLTTSNTKGSWHGTVTVRELGPRRVSLTMRGDWNAQLMRTEIPFSHSQGLQQYPAGHAKAGQLVVYRINKYEMVVNSSTKYEVVRFGLQNNGTIPPSRVSDAGLSAAHTVHPSWVPGYSPHSTHPSDPPTCPRASFAPS